MTLWFVLYTHQSVKYAILIHTIASMNRSILICLFRVGNFRTPRKHFMKQNKIDTRIHVHVIFVSIVFTRSRVVSRLCPNIGTKIGMRLELYRVLSCLDERKKFKSTRVTTCLLGWMHCNRVFFVSVKITWPHVVSCLWTRFFLLAGRVRQKHDPQTCIYRDMSKMSI